MSSTADTLVDHEAPVSVEHFKKAGPGIEPPFANEEFWEFTYSDGSVAIILDPETARHMIEHMPVILRA